MKHSILILLSIVVSASAKATTSAAYAERAVSHYKCNMTDFSDGKTYSLELLPTEEMSLPTSVRDMEVGLWKYSGQQFGIIVLDAKGESIVDVKTEDGWPLELSSSHLRIHIVCKNQKR